jgi:DNA-binding LacI/PurR family transcriptional regulator
MKRQGVLRGQGKRATCFSQKYPSGGYPRVSGDTAGGSVAWERAMASIETDIMAARFEPGEPLPPYKVLQNRYSVTFPTLKKALAGLAKRGLVEPHKRRYCVTPLRSKSSNRIVLVAQVWGEQTRSLGYLDMNFFRMLDAECANAGVSLDIVGVAELNGGYSFSNLFSSGAYAIENTADVLGYIYLVLHPQGAAPEIVRFIGRSGKPIACIDGRDYPVTQALPVAVRGAKIFSLYDDTLATQAIARHLLQLGHRSIAYFSVYDWPRRLREISNPISSARMDASVTHFSLYGDNPGFHRSALSRYGIDITSDPLEYDPEGWQRQIPASFCAGADRLARESILWQWLKAEIVLQLQPLFEQALRDRRITAWVSADDNAGLMANDFLKRNTVAVPGAVSLVTFGNRPEALREGITGYDFNHRGIIRAALRHVLRMPQPLSAGSRTRVRVEGQLVIRASSGRARAA